MKASMSIRSVTSTAPISSGFGAADDRSGARKANAMEEATWECARGEVFSAIRATALRRGAFGHW